MVSSKCWAKENSAGGCWYYVSASSSGSFEELRRHYLLCARTWMLYLSTLPTAALPHALALHTSCTITTTTHWPVPLTPACPATPLRPALAVSCHRRRSPDALPLPGSRCGLDGVILTASHCIIYLLAPRCHGTRRTGRWHLSARERCHGRSSDLVALNGLNHRDGSVGTRRRASSPATAFVGGGVCVTRLPTALAFAILRHAESGKIAAAGSCCVAFGCLRHERKRRSRAR